MSDPTPLSLSALIGGYTPDRVDLTGNKDGTITIRAASESRSTHIPRAADVAIIDGELSFRVLGSLEPDEPFMTTTVDLGVSS